MKLVESIIVGKQWKTLVGNTDHIFYLRYFPDPKHVEENEEYPYMNMRIEKESPIELEKIGVTGYKHYSDIILQRPSNIEKKFDKFYFYRVSLQICKDSHRGMGNVLLCSSIPTEVEIPSSMIVIKLDYLYPNEFVMMYTGDSPFDRPLVSFRKDNETRYMAHPDIGLLMKKFSLEGAK